MARRLWIILFLLFCLVMSVTGSDDDGGADEGEGERTTSPIYSMGQIKCT